MPTSHLPRFALLASTNLQPGYQHATLISALRGLAALQVVAAHIRAQLFPSLRLVEDPTLWYQALAFLTGFAHQAVVLFFLLSGWLVGGSLLNKQGQPGVFLSYAIDRLTRLWIVLIPAFVLTLLLAIATGAVDPGRPDLAQQNEYSITAFGGNLFGLQDMAVPRFGGNFALWSMANEIWYYALLPLLLLTFTGKRLATRGAALALALFACWHLSINIVLYFPIWLLGTAASRIRVDASGPARLAMVAALLLISVYYRLTGNNDTLVPASFVQDLVFSVAFLLLLCSLQLPGQPHGPAMRIAAAASERLAAFSFTLYVIHVPLLLLLRDHAPLLKGGLSPHRLSDLGIYLGVLLTLTVLAWLFYLPFEAQTGKLRRWLKQALTTARLKPARPV